MDAQGPKRDLGAAKKAYLAGDVEAAARAHSTQVAHEDHAPESGKYIKSIVYGGLDGIITTFSVVASVAGAQLSTSVVLILGFANLFADALSMGVGDAISSKAENELNRSERAREKWECDNFIEGERREMVELYHQKGLSLEDAETVVSILSKDTEFFVDIMMVEELNLMPLDESESPVKNGMVTFASFVVFGLIPLVAYLVTAETSKVAKGSDTVFIVACVLTALTLFALGAVKAKIVRQKWWLGGLHMLLVGIVTAAVSFLIGLTIAEIIGEDAAGAA
eukprot:TRINITY_DN5110_c0_g1_i1.p1 TRINITY_DN5110_c0_g1~~TRINITY_DN5110_c0_g1_i1.p1  ORF type:complete len:280 (+),score=100.77 TRINITY_DN5110_c0_g1_i1:59-898(+)